MTNVIKIHHILNTARGLISSGIWAPLLRTSHARYMHSSSSRLQSTECEADATDLEAAEEAPEGLDKVRIVDPDTSRQYLQSEAYKSTYGDEPVWVPYRRNFKGQIPPEKTRKTCMRGGRLATGNPCPICRDEYLVLHHTNVNLLKQFVSPHSGEILPFSKTGVCQKQQKNLLVAVEQAVDKGLLETTIPFRKYDYSQYYSDLVKKPT